MKKLALACFLFLSTAAMANPGSLPPGEGGMGERDLRALMDQRVNRLPANAPLGLVPIGDEGVEAEEEVAPATAGKLPPIMINAKVKSYQKVVVGRRRVSMSSRGAVTPAANDGSDLIYKTVPVVEQKAVDISPIIEKYAAKYNLDPWLIRGVIV